MDSTTLAQLKIPIGGKLRPSGSNAASAKKLLSAANVRRFHTVPILGEQNIGHHSHRVCLVLRYLLDGNVPAHLYEAALFHDLAESDTGDIPAQTKWASNELNELIENWEKEWHVDNGTHISLSDDEAMMLAVADKLELVWFCTEQMMLGNKHMERIRNRGIEYCMNSDLPDPFFGRMKRFVQECEHEC